ncbi:MAG: hydroxymethylbilane synthase [Tepidisphaeraceae bacterium]|jgi:hydroxymethylbilane synthase
MSAPAHLRLGTRGSLLARTQSGQIAERLRQSNPGLNVELITVSTSGDRLIDRPLSDAGGKGLFTKELELALLANEIDLAVHSLKDVPVTMPLVDQADLTIAAVPVREDARDCLVSRRYKSLAELPQGATVGTGSLRRRCQILQARPDLTIAPLRGNIDTRLRKLDSGQYDAIVLAMAGLKRIGRWEAAWMTPIEFSQILPAAGQGALALQCRRADRAVIGILEGINHPETADAVAAERAVVAGLGGDCHSPIAVWATVDPTRITLSAAVGASGGQTPVAYASASAPRHLWQQAVESICRTFASPRAN